MKYSMFFKGNKKGLSKEQINAIGYYRYCNIQWDRYADSVFYIPNGARDSQLLTDIQNSVKECKKLNCGDYC